MWGVWRVTFCTHEPSQRNFAGTELCNWVTELLVGLPRWSLRTAQSEAESSAGARCGWRYLEGVSGAKDTAGGEGGRIWRGHPRGGLLWRVESCKHPSDILKSETEMCKKKTQLIAVFLLLSHIWLMWEWRMETDKVQGRECRWGVEVTPIPIFIINVRFCGTANPAPLSALVKKSGRQSDLWKTLRKSRWYTCHFVYLLLLIPAMYKSVAGPFMCCYEKQREWLLLHLLLCKGFQHSHVLTWVICWVLWLDQMRLTSYFNSITQPGTWKKIGCVHEKCHVSFHFLPFFFASFDEVPSNCIRLVHQKSFCAFCKIMSFFLIVIVWQKIMSHALSTTLIIRLSSHDSPPVGSAEFSADR